MGFFDRLRRKAFAEFIDIIEWTDTTSNTIIWKFPRYNAEIKNGAQLTVRETQIAVLVSEGKFADVYKPGRYVLNTQNMPILTTLEGWKYGFKSPFKVDVYFVNTKQFIDQKWGTSNSIMMRDPEFGPIRMRAFGSYCFRVKDDPIPFIKTIVGTNPNFTTEHIQGQLRNFVITKFTDYLAESDIAALDLAANINEFSEEIELVLKKDFDDYGIELTKFLISNISLPEVVEQALDRRSSMKVIEDMETYTEMQLADSLVEGAKNPSGGRGLAADAMGAGIGLAYADRLMQQKSKKDDSQVFPQIPPPIPGEMELYIAVEGNREGPLSKKQFKNLAAQKKVTRQTLVWMPGMAQWVEAGSVCVLSDVWKEKTSI